MPLRSAVCCAAVPLCLQIEHISGGTCIVILFHIWRLNCQTARAAAATNWLGYSQRVNINSKVCAYQSMRICWSHRAVAISCIGFAGLSIELIGMPSTVKSAKPTGVPTVNPLQLTVITASPTLQGDIEGVPVINLSASPTTVLTSLQNDDEANGEYDSFRNTSSSDASPPIFLSGLSGVSVTISLLVVIVLASWSLIAASRFDNASEKRIKTFSEMSLGEKRSGDEPTSFQMFELCVPQLYRQTKAIGDVIIQEVITQHRWVWVAIQIFTVLQMPRPCTCIFLEQEFGNVYARNVVCG